MVIARGGGDYDLMPMSDGSVGQSPSLNSQQIGAECRLLLQRDIIQIADMQLQFSFEK